MKRSPTVLAYHAVGDCPREMDTGNLFVSVSAFERQMAFLARKRRVVSLDEVIESGPPDRVAITFDDGYRSVVTNAAPILKRYGFPATVFVPTAWIGGRNEWDDPRPRCDVDVMTRDEVSMASSVGLVVQSHGHRHIDMAVASVEEVRNDVQASADAIGELTGTMPRFLAYPFGRSSAAARAAVEEMGFAAAFTIDSPHEGRYAWERIPVTPLDGPALFALKTSGRYPAARRSPIVSGAYRLVRPAVRRLLGG